MASTSTAVDAGNHLDPWGFGRAAADDTGELVEFLDPAFSRAPSHQPETHSRSGASSRAFARPTTDVSEWSTSAAPVEPGGPALPRQMLGVLAVFALVILAQAFYIGFSLVDGTTAASVAELVVSSHPSGAQVLVDGQVKGTTPASLSVPAGAHLVEVVAPGGVTEPFPIDLTPGERWVQHVALAASAEPGMPTRGTLRVETGTALAQISIDGELAGSTPLACPNLAAGEHLVRAVFSKGGVVERRITIGGGQTVALVLDPPAPRSSVPAGPVSGWLRLDTPFPVQVFEDGSLVGTSDSERLMMSAGGHVLELVNAALGYRVLVRAVVKPGAVTPLAVDAPKAAVHVNAQPWAAVTVDGRPVGETPLANLQLPLGTHEVIFTHPDLGQRAQTITVRATGANRVSMDLRR